MYVLRGNVSMSNRLRMAESCDKNKLKNVFELFSKFGDSKSDGTTITLTQSDKWMKQAQIIDGKNITTTDTAICFNKFKSKNMNVEQYMKFCEELATQKKMDPGVFWKKLIACEVPGMTNVAKTIKSEAVDRLTDTSKYTGTHKERFDESGKGKGAEGRTDKAETSGYVSGYKNKDTYDKSRS